MDYRPIGDYGVIGDRRTAALVGRDGSIDWLCLPDFDGPSVFASLLDAERGGRFLVEPQGGGLGESRYLGDTNVLRLRFGALEVTDLMADLGPRPAASEGRRVLIRRLEAKGGSVRCRLLVAPAYDYGRVAASVELVEGGALFRGPGPTLRLAAPAPLERQGSRVEAWFDLQPGEVRWVVLAAADGEDSGWTERRAEEAYEAALRYWREWAVKVSYHGPHRRAMIRSALLIHLLSYAPRGSLVAAPTTSLPEIVGGPKNWDYRYAWVRDASLSIAALALLGPIDDAKTYMDWLLTLPPDEATGAPLRVMYGIRGETDLTERTVDHLPGYRDSRPVRIGNRAHLQLQLDAFGILAECAEVYLRAGGQWETGYSDLIRRVADFVADNWQRPGHDVWELGHSDHFVNSKMLSWVALDRSVKIVGRVGGVGDTDRWRRAMGEIRREVLARGWSDREGAFVQRYGTNNLDAAVLLGPILGFLPARDARSLATIERLRERLSERGMLRRFLAEETPSGGPPGEGAFNPCTLWMVTALARAGWASEAEYLLDKLLQNAEPLGLLSEEIDPASGKMLGNYSLLFSQAELVRAVFSLQRSSLGRRAMALGLRAWQVGLERGERTAQGLWALVRPRT